jgi:predicted RNA methylase
VATTIDPDGAELDALRRLAPVRGLRVLELGCGDGRLTVRYMQSAARVLAVDPDEAKIAAARAALPAALADRVTFAAVGAAEVDAPRQSFDLALFSWSL